MSAAGQLDIRYSYRGLPTLREFASSDAFIRGLVGPFGSGKSSACIAEFPTRAQEQAPGPDGMRRTRWAAVRSTYRELEDSTIRSFHQWLPPQHFGRWYEQDKRFVIKAFQGCEFEVLFRALDKPDDVKKLLSTEFTGAWVNEARETPWAIVDALQGRVGRYPPRSWGGPTWFGIWMDTNPPDIDSEWYKFFEDRGWLKSFLRMQEEGIFPRSMMAEEFAAIFKQPSGRSPLAENIDNLPPGYYHKLAVGKSDEWIKVYVDGQYGFVSNDKLVYPQYSDEIHCKKVEPIEGITIYRGWDFGLTPAVALSQLLPDGRFLVFDEICATDLGVDKFSDDVLDHCSRSFNGRAYFQDYGDPAGNSRMQTDERTCFDILRSKGVQIEPGLQDPTIRWESVRRPLTKLVNGQPQFILHPRCRQLRKGFLGGYHFRRLSTTSERYSDRAEKNNFSHVHDGLQYVATILFGGGLTADAMGRDDWPDGSQDRDESGRSEVTGY